MAYDLSTITPNRQTIENEVERLIGLLDGMDPDDGVEDDGSAEDDNTGEPSLGASEHLLGWNNFTPPVTAHDADLEEDGSDYELDADSEPDHDGEGPSHPTDWAIQFIDKGEVRL